GGHRSPGPACRIGRLSMKRVISSLILVLALVPLVLLTRWNSEAKAPWSLPVADTRARLTAPRFLWRQGDIVQLVVRMKARGGEARLPSGLPVELVVEHE